MKRKNDPTKIKILVCCHKICDLPQDDIFLPIQVGAAISDVDLCIQRDDQLNGEVCDNISEKNKSYCELTAMYWAWKNIKKIYPSLEYIGLNHYRRFFKFRKFFTRIAYYKKDKDVCTYKFNESKIHRLIEKDITIVAKANNYPYSLAVEYSVSHISEDLKALIKVVHEIYPDYDDVMYNFFNKNNKLKHYNMFIMKWNEYEKYCTWLFSIFDVLERKIDITNYNDVQKRIWGYMAERLFNVYLIKNKIKVSSFPVYIYNNKKESLIHYSLNRIRYTIGFLITNRLR